MKSCKPNQETIDMLVDKFSVSEKKLKKFHNQLARYFTEKETKILLPIIAEYAPQNYLVSDIRKATFYALNDLNFDINHELAPNYILSLVNYDKFPYKYGGIASLDRPPLSFDQFIESYP